MTDQDIRSELKMLYFSMETFSGIKMAFDDYANTLDASSPARQAISSAFDSDDEGILPTSGVGLMLTLKLFLLYVANGNGRVTAQQLSYIDKMVDDDILSASVSAASLMAQIPSFNEGPLYPIKILDVLIRNDLMSKYLHPENNNQSRAIRCVRVFSELGRGVISLDKNAVSTQRYREFIQNLRDLAIESGDGAYSKADFAFVAANINSFAKRNSTQTTAPAKKATAKKAAPPAEPVSQDGYVIVGTGEKKIKQRMFKNRLDLEKVEIAEGVQQINSNAFDGCGNLKEIRLPSSLTKIDVAAFNGCKNLSEVALPDGMAEIGNRAFSSCEKLQEIVLPDSVTKIGKGAFAGCQGLQKVVLPRNLTCIQERAFNGCSNLKEIHLPDSLRTIESAAFGSSGIVEVVLPEGMEKLDLGAFQKTHELRRIYIPDSVTEARGWGALDRNVEWISMSSATAEKSAHTNSDIQRFLKKIQLRGVDDAEKERIIRCAEDDGTLRLLNTTEIQNWEFSGRKDLKKIVVPEGVTKIGKSAFNGCTNLREIILPESITEIAYGAFSGCAKLQSIVLPDNITKISPWVFSGCKSLQSINLPDGITEIGSYAFHSCESLQSIVLPPKLQKLESMCFFDCKALTDLVMPASIREVGYDIIGGSHEKPVYITHLGVPFGLLLSNTSEANSVIYKIPRAIYNLYKNNAFFRVNQFEIVDSESSTPASALRSAGNPGATYAVTKSGDANADRRRQLEAQIRSLEAERDAVRGIFGGMKRRKLQSQIDELRAELRRLS